MREVANPRTIPFRNLSGGLRRQCLFVLNLFAALAQKERRGKSQK
jgi:hypothetical protein